MPTPFRLSALVLLAALAACDFTPTLDIDLPEHERRTVINALLVADSVAVVRTGVSTDPYVTDPRAYYGNRTETNPDAVVTLLRDGREVERLRVQSAQCDRYDYSGNSPSTYECGPFVGSVPLAAGGRYTVRVEQPGLPAAEGTVRLPKRPALAVEEEARDEDGRRRFRVRVADPAGRGDRYGVSVIEGPYQETYPVCDYRTDPPTCVDRTATRRQPAYFSSTDPVILAAARTLDLDDNFFRFVTVDDQSFDGRTWAFSLTAGLYYYGEESTRSDVMTVQVASLAEDVYDAYQIATFGGQGEENPFAEPINLPSNVTGGYGLVGGLTLAEVTMEAQYER